MLDFSPFDPAFRDNPFRRYPELLARSPGEIVLDGVKSLFVARIEHISEVVRNVELFSSEKPKLPGLEKVDFFNGMPVLPYIDPPTHTRLRKLIAPAFLPKSIGAYTERAAPALLAMVEALDGRDAIDFVGDFADRVPMLLLLDLLLDLPREDWPVFTAITAAQGALARTPPGGEKPTSFITAWQDGLAYCARLIEARRQNPGDGLIGSLIALGDNALTADELLAMLLLLYTAGLNTISTHLAGGMLLLLRHPDQRARLAGDPGLVHSATEEMLRFDAPNLSTWRFATSEGEIAGVKVAPAMPVYILNGAANYDETRHADPYRFDIGRQPKPHASFGEGIHFCIGAPIARLASHTIFPTLLHRFPELALADPAFKPAYEGTPTVRRMKSLPIRLRG